MNEARLRVSAQFSRNLRACRKRAGLTQEALANCALLKRSAVGTMERGERIPGIDMLIVPAACLKVAPAELLRGIEWKRPEISEVDRLGGRAVEARRRGFKVTDGPGHG